MTDEFDPYHRWLGIPPKQQPANLYRLLGIELFENDVDVIRDAAEQRMAHVRTYHLGKHSELSQKILNELAGAKARLLDPSEKAAYDALLRATLVGQASAIAAAEGGTIAPPPGAAGSGPPARDLSDLLNEAEREAAALPPVVEPRRWRRPAWLPTRGRATPTRPAPTVAASGPHPARLPRSVWTLVGVPAAAVAVVLGLLLWFSGNAMETVEGLAVLFQQSGTSPEQTASKEAPPRPDPSPVPPPPKPAGPKSPSLVLAPIPDARVEVGSRVEIPIRVERNGCQGAAAVNFHGLPEHVRPEGDPIPTERDSGTFRLNAQPNARTGESEIRVVAALAGVMAEQRFKLAVTNPVPRASDQPAGPPAPPSPPPAILLSSSGGGPSAKINQPGRVAYPVVRVHNYVFEAELTLAKPQLGRIRFRFGEPAHATEISLGSIWDGDKSVPDVLCRLFRAQPYGINWWGERRLPAGQRLSLSLVAMETKRALFWDRQHVLSAWAIPVDLSLAIITDGSPDCSLHSWRVRELQDEDLRKLRWRMPQHNAALKPEAAAARIRAQTANLSDRPEKGEPFSVKSIGAPMRWIAPGEFEIGGKGDAEPSSRTTPRVRLTSGFWIGQYEVTQGQWLTLASTNPSRITGSPYLPVNWISWEEASQFCDRVGQMEMRAGRVPAGYEYRLPTEAEWEYSCKAGSTGRFGVEGGKFAWARNGAGAIHEVGDFPPNAWGLYDMHGNVSEWCMDQWRPYPADSEKVWEDPVSFRQGAQPWFVIRGGCWASLEEGDLVSTSRDKSPSVAGGYRGFRIVLGKKVVVPPQAPAKRKRR